MTHRFSKGFTLFEFLVVVAITGIVVIVMVWNSQYFLTQVKVMKVKEEHALLRRALEKYRVDYAAYPNGEQKLAALNRPSAYVASMPQDPFQSDRQEQSYQYFNRPGGGFAWVLVSPGPDGVIDFVPQAASVAPREDPRIDMLAFSSAGKGRGPQPRLSLAEIGATPNATRAPTPSPDEVAKGEKIAERDAFLGYIAAIQYDPTNGVDSSGDIISVSDH